MIEVMREEYIERKQKVTVEQNNTSENMNVFSQGIICIAEPGDYIVTNSFGNKTVYKPELFHAIFEKATGDK